MVRFPKCPIGAVTKTAVCAINLAAGIPNMMTTELTAEQREAMVRLSNNQSVAATITTEVLQQLVGLGLLYKRADGHLDISAEGERLQAELRR